MENNNPLTTLTNDELAQLGDQLTSAPVQNKDEHETRLKNLDRRFNDTLGLFRRLKLAPQRPDHDLELSEEEKRLVPIYERTFQALYRPPVVWGDGDLTPNGLEDLKTSKDVLVYLNHDH